MSIIFELQNIVWKHLLLKDLLNLCSITKSFYLMWQNDYTWQYLLQRDYHSSAGTKETYI